MTAAASVITTELEFPRFVIGGNLKVEIHDISIISGDTTATAVATKLSRLDKAILIANVRQSAIPSYSSLTATFTFADPTATVKGHVILFGK